MGKRIELDVFESEHPQYNAVVLETPEIDTFCTSTAWLLPALSAFHPDFEPFLYQLDSGYLCLGRGHAPHLGRFLAPLEAMWGLASPVAGRDPLLLAEEVTDHFRSIESEWDTLWLCGLDARSVFFESITSRLMTRYRLGLGPRTKRHEASLEGGAEGWLSRRSRKFRKGLRRAEKRTVESGFEFDFPPSPESVAEAEALYARCIAIEKASWKGRAEVGIQSGAMYAFYEDMVRRLAGTGCLLTCFVTHEGRDIGFLFGAHEEGLFRGLQMSFHDEYRRYEIGNLMQLEVIRRLADRGTARYDLGSALAYKKRWAEGGRETSALAVMQH